jgi:hypothetical protein
VNPYYEKVDVLGISVKVKVKDKDAPVLNLHHAMKIYPVVTYVILNMTDNNRRMEKTT